MLSACDSLGAHFDALLGIDADPEALAVAAERLAGYGERVRLTRGNFRDLVAIAS